MYGKCSIPSAMELAKLLPWKTTTITPTVLGPVGLAAGKKTEQETLFVAWLQCVEKKRKNRCLIKLNLEIYPRRPHVTAAKHLNQYAKILHGYKKCLSTSSLFLLDILKFNYFFNFLFSLFFIFCSRPTSFAASTASPSPVPWRARPCARGSAKTTRRIRSVQGGGGHGKDFALIVVVWS